MKCIEKCLYLGLGEGILGTDLNRPGSITFRTLAKKISITHRGHLRKLQVNYRAINNKRKHNVFLQQGGGGGSELVDTCSRKAFCNDAIFDEKEGGHGHDLVALRNLGHLVNIHLQEHDVGKLGLG